MSLKRILGSVLASRLAGRGRRRHSTLGPAALLGGLGYRRRPRLAGKAGLAAMGYMAYKAYRDHQANNPQGQAGQSPAGQGQATASNPRPGGGNPSGTSGGIGGMVQDLVDKVSAVASQGSGTAQGGGNQGQRPASAVGSDPEPEPTEAELQQDAAAADRIDDDRALLLLRAMITASYADGAMSSDERQRIMSHIAETDATEEDRRVMEREVANPKTLDELLTQVNDTETAEEFYLASSAAVNGETEANAAYLETLRQRLLISKEDALEIDELTA